MNFCVGAVRQFRSRIRRRRRSSCIGYVVNIPNCGFSIQLLSKLASVYSSLQATISNLKEDRFCKVDSELDHLYRLEFSIRIISIRKKASAIWKGRGKETRKRRRKGKKLST
ncbi:uncharacterized protein LOC105422040 [Pogonomyrmex barbatus]|uniref:Uncharacterized protein LOC105422040 n=1 Tax=Pogonomyrmex barbatus TaxID=144034 RepID=A0A6I9VM71_9HYME|nr:uncharacterized protein LOC105422040 [Pogonomyrmex barbatus]